MSPRKFRCLKILEKIYKNVYVFLDICRNTYAQQKLRNKFQTFFFFLLIKAFGILYYQNIDKRLILYYACTNFLSIFLLQFNDAKLFQRFSLNIIKLKFNFDVILLFYIPWFPVACNIYPLCYRKAYAYVYRWNAFSDALQSFCCDRQSGRLRHWR